MDVLVILTKNNRPMTLEELGKESNRDKTTVFRSTQKLVRLGICNKETKSLKEGGQYHIYSAIPIDIFKKETEKKINELEQSLRRILKRFEKDMQDMISAFYSTSLPSKVS
jgi:predicted transcriptional regulator